MRPIPKRVNYAVFNSLRETHADIVFVGLGCPLQELWMIQNRRRVSSGVFLGVGAAFDFISGDKPQAPSWMQNAGLEWAFRFSHEPRRLWHRYTVINMFFLIYFFWESVRHGLKSIVEMRRQ
jgi:N-acetylglucosaminyldiphosphoundecaprenol N-acetyl-beta-D-mannosaminyltransferase